MSPRNILTVLGAVAIAYVAGGCRTAQEQEESRAAAEEIREAARGRAEESLAHQAVYRTVRELGDRFAGHCADYVRVVHAGNSRYAERVADATLHVLVDQREKAIEAAGCESGLEWRCIIGTSDEPSGTGPRVVIPAHEYSGAPSIVVRGKDGRDMHIGGNGAGPYWRDGPEDRWKSMGSYNTVGYTPREHIDCRSGPESR